MLEYIYQLEYRIKLTYMYEYYMKQVLADDEVSEFFLSFMKKNVEGHGFAK